MRPTRASARRRTRNTPVMDARTRTNSNAMKGLLGRQLASITDTLARASQRRDAELQQKANLKSPPAPAVQLPAAPSPTNPSLTSDTEGTGSDSGDSVVLGGYQDVPNNNGFEIGKYEVDLPQANDISGRITSMPPEGCEPLTNACAGDTVTRDSLTGGYASNGDDPKKMLACIEQVEPFAVSYNDTDPQQMLAHRDQLNPADNARDVDDPKNMLAAFPQVESNKEHDSNDVSSMLADLDRASSAGGSTIRGEVEYTDPKQMLAEFERLTSDMDEASFSGDAHDDPRRMLAELEGQEASAEDVDVPSGSDNDASAMLAELERRAAQFGGGAQKDDHEDLEMLHNRLTGVPSPGTAAQSLAPGTKNVDRPEAVFNPAIVPYVIAMQLEIAGCEWQEAQGWTTFLFSSGLGGYKARQEKDRIVEQATEELDRIIRYTLGEEEAYQGKVSVARLPRRLIVSNIAADAGEEDLKEFFYRHRFVV